MVSVNAVGGRPRAELDHSRFVDACEVYASSVRADAAGMARSIHVSVSL
jgi:hypothetical protein